MLGTHAKSNIIKLILWIYILVLLLLAVFSSLVVFVTESRIRFLIDIFVNAVFVGGVLLYALDRKLNSWKVLVSIAVILQIVLWFYPDLKMDAELALLIIFLMPAILMGWIVGTNKDTIQEASKN